MRQKLITLILALAASVGTLLADEILSIDFTRGQGDWTIENKELGGLNAVWVQTSNYGMKATGYVNSASHVTESWLISPTINLSSFASATLYFSHARRYGNISDLSVRAYVSGSWQILEVSKWPDGSSWDFVDAYVDLSVLAGLSDAKIAFVYTSSIESHATWEVKTVTVTATTTNRVQIGDLYYILDASNQTAEVTYKSYINYEHNTDWNIENANIPESVTYNSKTYSVTRIGEYAFRRCSGLTSVTIPNSVTNIGNTAFASCTGLTSVTIPNSVTSIGGDAFASCTGLTSVTIPNSVTSIGNYAFFSCSGLTSVTIPNSVTNIGIGAFSMVVNINYLGTATGSPWGARCVNGYVDGYLVYSDEAKNTLAGCSSAATGKIIIPNSVTSIGNSAFFSCSGLTSITIPNSVTSIGNSAFFSCSGLTSVTIGKNVANIGSGAFYNCTSLTNITWNAKDCPTASNNAADIPFYSIRTQIKSFTFGNEVKVIPDFICCGMQNLSSIEIPNSVTSTGKYAFALCSGLTNVTIPESITSIGEGTFLSCSGLTSVNIPNSVTSIEYGAFSACSDLKSIEIPHSVTSLGESAFQECSALTILSLGENITAYGDSAFAGCPAITTIYNYRNRPAKLGKGVFTDVDYFNCTLYVLAGSVDMYKSSGSDWKDFYFIEPIGAETVVTDEMQVAPTETTAAVTWPKVENAATYELLIKDKSGNVVCTLIFNANGQLTQITFAAPARDHSTQSSGFSFTVTGLDSGTSYDLTITAKDENGTVLQTTTQSFTTAGGASAVDNVPTGDTRLRKMLIDGQLLIIKNGRTYTVQGQEVR